MSNTQILLALDGSAYSVAAGKVAIQIAKANSASILAVHVVNVRPPSGNILSDLSGHLGFEPAVVSKAIAHKHDMVAKSLVEQFAEEAGAAGVVCEARVVHGGVSHTLAELSNSVDLLIMGTRGETEESFEGQGGAMSSWLPEHAGCSILLVTKDVSEIQRIAIGYDGSESSEHAARALRRFFEEMSVKVYGVFVSEDGEGEVLNGLKDSLSGFDLQLDVVMSDSPHDALVRHAAENHCDLLAMGFEGNHPMRDFLWGTATSEVVRSQKLAVLISH